MKIEVITMMYNEAVLAPLFVRHYAPWVDKFTVFYSKSTDDTRRELEKAAAQCGVKSLDIVPFEFPKGFNDRLKIERINKAVRESSADFVICVDADEFVHPWPFDGANPRDELAKETGNAVRCTMFNVYRHATDADIDPAKPPLFQRRHGVPLGSKPCIVRTGCGAQFSVGCHELVKPRWVRRVYRVLRTIRKIAGVFVGPSVKKPVTPKQDLTLWHGTHWGKADDFCISRYVRDRRDRLSDLNRKRGHGMHHFDATEEKIFAELKEHENDPLLF